MAKKPKNTEEEGDEAIGGVTLNTETGMIDVDILDMEMTKGLPYWLSGQQQHSHKHDAARKAKQKAHSNAIASKSKKKK
jgi:hypothetical protein